MAFGSSAFGSVEFGGSVGAGVTTALVAATGTFALAGISTTFMVQLPAAPASYALAGQTIAFSTIASVQTGVFTLSGIAVAFDTFFGGTILQPAADVARFTRRRYREWLAEIEAAKAAELRKQDELVEAARVAAREAIDKARAQVLADRAAQAARFTEEQRLRQHAAALASDQAMINLRDVMHVTNRMAADAAARAHALGLQEQDDDEALALLLMHGES